MEFRWNPNTGSPHTMHGLLQISHGLHTGAFGRAKSPCTLCCDTLERLRVTQLF